MLGYIYASTCVHYRNLTHRFLLPNKMTSVRVQVTQYILQLLQLFAENAYENIELFCWLIRSAVLISTFKWLEVNLLSCSQFANRFGSS
jgi:hypothetical protein